jgi:hypothetical protein
MKTDNFDDASLKEATLELHRLMNDPRAVKVAAQLTKDGRPETRSTICFDWSRNTPDVGNLDGLVRLIDEAIEKNMAKNREKNLPLEAKAQPTPSRPEQPATHSPR